MAQNINLFNKIKMMPKLDLHCHLDGSLTTDFVRQILDLEETVQKTEEQMYAPENCQSLTEYLRCFDLPIMCLQTPEHITSAVLNVIHQAAAENVLYLEIRFAPTFSVNSSQNYSAICEAAIEGCKQGLMQYGVHSSIILCAMRHLDLDTNLSVLKIAREYLGNGVCALDLAGDESKFSNELFSDLFLEAKRLEMPMTIHSGECGSDKNVEIALEVGAKRVGHGIALRKNPNLISKCKEKRLGLELCPTSNYQTGAVQTTESYPLKDFLNFGLLASVNTDNRTVSQTNSTKELELSCKKFEINEKDLRTLYQNSVEISFADDSIKHMLLQKTEEIHF